MMAFVRITLCVALAVLMVITVIGTLAVDEQPSETSDSSENRRGYHG